jgi:ABC-type antimicrobial peptide transport system permease subunit
MISTIKTFQTAIRALRRNITRSALTCVGIVIGIAAVIAMMEIGNGVSALNSQAIASLGANNLMIMPGQAASGGISFGAGSNVNLTPDDFEAIEKNCPAVKAAAPTVGANAQIIYQSKNWVPMQITGTTPDYMDVRGWPIVMGDNFTDSDVRNSNKVCLIGQTIKRELFGADTPIGKELRLGAVSLRVVGVLSRKGANMFGRDQDDIIIAPWTTIKYRVSGQGSSLSSAGAASSSTNTMNSLNNIYPAGVTTTLYPAQSQMQTTDSPMPIRFANIGSINAAAKSAPEIPIATQQITDVLRERHHLKPGQPDDFQIRDMTELSDTLGKTTALIATLLLIVATISLAVGGVGIMNIMLVSVTERTREIGLRMAVGARAIDILLQFLVEAIVLCLLGGIIGIALGRGTSIMVRTFMQWPTAISIPAIVASVLVSAIVGLVFGFYPAWKASRLDPIEALRYE